jgi:hypothetical protein
MLLINRLGLYAGLLLALTADAGAQQRDCFTVAMTSSTGGEVWAQFCWIDAPENHGYSSAPFSAAERLRSDGLPSP